MPDDVERVRDAYAALMRLVGDVSADVQARIDERCPYRTALDACTFRGPCENQRRAAASVACGGDHRLRRPPALPEMNHDQP